MAGFMSYIYPSDPNAVFKLSHFCAVWGSIGVLVASFLRELLNNYILGSWDESKCPGTAFEHFEKECTSYILARRASSAFWNQFSHLIVMLFGLITCIPFYAMEDIYSGYESAPLMRNALILGTVMEIMDSAFSVGIRTSSGIISTIYKPNDQHGINPYPIFIIGSSILSNALTWVTFLRDAILAFGVLLACVYDRDVQAIGGNWQIIGWITAIAGLANTIMEFLKVFNFSFFDDKSDFTYYLFEIMFTVWMVFFGLHCNSQVTGEEKGMLDDDASSGSDVSEGEPIKAAPAAASTESEPEVTEKKKHRKHRKEREASDDDV